MYYLLGLLFSCAGRWFFYGSRALFGIYNTLAFWLGPLIFIILGLAVGCLLCALNSPRKMSFLTYAALIGTVLYCIAFASFQFYDWYHSRYLENIEANEYFLNNNSYPRQEIQAFKMLTANYKNPNDLILTQATVTPYDSIVRGVKTNFYEIQFVYVRKHQRGRYKSSCTLIGDKGILHYFDRRLGDAEERKMDSANNEGRRDGLKSILDDSVKFSLDSATKASLRNKIKEKQIVLDTLSAP